MKPIFYRIAAVVVVCVFTLTSVLADPSWSSRGKRQDKQKEQKEKSDEHKEKSDDKSKDKCEDKDNGHGKKCGTGILHLDLKEKMLNEGAPSNATVCVEISYHSQGNVTVQRMEVKARKLDTNTTYQLWTALGDETNFLYVTDFATDTNGNARLNYKTSTITNTKCLGKDTLLLPVVLDPVYDIHELAIGNVNTQAVFSAGLARPDKLQYLIKRCFTNDAVSAGMNLHATTRWTKFCLSVAGLQGSTNYFLTVNNAAVSSGTSKSNGTLKFSSLPVAPADILTVTNIGVWDSLSNTVISTTLPQDTFTTPGSTNDPVPTLLK